jgi:HAE1 family hydrophobic/amphiphilic exporter-1
MDKTAEKIARVDQKSAIILQIVKQSDANAVAVSEQVYKTITKLENDYKDNAVKLNVANDSTILPLAADSVIHDLLIAVFLVAFVMLFFLHSIRNSLIVMVSIPAL